MSRCPLGSVVRASRTALAGGLVLVAVAGCGDESAAPRPNVVVVLLDTVRRDALAAGEHRAATPFLDDLRVGAVEFPNARSTSSWTAPATASLFTGLYPNENGVIQGFLAHRQTAVKMREGGADAIELRSLPSDIPTLPERFHAGGYRTFGLAANINIGPEIGFSRGFDRFQRLNDAPADALVDSAAAWLPAMADGDAPYFLYVHLNDAHEPYEAHDPWYEPVADDPVEDNRNRYLSEISFLDGQLARLVDRLGLKNRGLLVIVSDHGEAFGEHGRVGYQGTLYRELNDVVCLVHGPALGVQPAVRPELVSLVDILPTVLDLAGLPAPDSRSGVSLAPLCRQSGDAPALTRALENRTVFAHRLQNLLQARHLWAAMSGSWKLLEGSRGFEALYDRGRDPLELRPLERTDDPVGEELAAVLDDFRRRQPVGRGEEVSVPLDRELEERLQSLGYVR